MSDDHRAESSMMLFEWESGIPADGSSCGVYVVQNGEFRFVNPRFAAMGAYTERELLGLESAGLIHPEDRRQARENAVSMLKGERTLPYTFRIIARDGSVKQVRETVQAISFEGKRAVRGYSMEIAAQREAAASLQELQTLQDAILDALPVAVMGMQSRRIVLANHAVESVFGWTPEELIGRSARVLYRTPEDYEKIGKSAYRALQRHRSYKTEFHCRRKGGKHIVCLVSAARIGESLQDDRIIATYEDITERKRVEKALEESERMLRALLRSYEKKLKPA